MAQQVQVLATMPDDLSSTPRALLVEGGTDSTGFPLVSTDMLNKGINFPIKEY